jgi:hypothetical protein
LRDDDEKETARDMQSGAAPILEELGMTWPEVMDDQHASRTTALPAKEGGE